MLHLIDSPLTKRSAYTVLKITKKYINSKVQYIPSSVLVSLSQVSENRGSLCFTSSSSFPCISANADVTESRVFEINVLSPKTKHVQMKCDSNF